jgi:hypothetical protein
MRRPDFGTKIEEKARREEKREERYGYSKTRELLRFASWRGRGEPKEEEKQYRVWEDSERKSCRV